MGTKAQIAFFETEGQKLKKGNTVYIYKHQDGYPEGVLPILIPFCKSFDASRGLSDTFYATARFISELCKVYDKFESDYGITEPQYLNIGAGTMMSDEIDYFYYVCPEMIIVFANSYDDGKWVVDQVIGLVDSNS